MDSLLCKCNLDQFWDMREAQNYTGQFYLQGRAIVLLDLKTYVSHFKLLYVAGW